MFSAGALIVPYGTLPRPHRTIGATRIRDTHRASFLSTIATRCTYLHTYIQLSGRLVGMFYISNSPPVPAFHPLFPDALDFFGVGIYNKAWCSASQSFRPPLGQPGDRQLVGYRQVLASSSPGKKKLHLGMEFPDPGPTEQIEIKTLGPISSLHDGTLPHDGGITELGNSPR